MGIAVTTPSALEEYEQIEVVNGLGGPLYGPANPSGMFNFVTKRPTEEPFGEIELDYEGSTVATAHIDVGRTLGQETRCSATARICCWAMAMATLTTASSGVSWPRWRPIFVPRPTP